MNFTFYYSNQGVRFELILAVQFSGFIQFYRRIPASCSLLFFSSLKTSNLFTSATTETNTLDFNIYQVLCPLSDTTSAVQCGGRSVWSTSQNVRHSVRRAALDPLGSGECAQRRVGGGGEEHTPLTTTRLTPSSV